MSAEVALPTIGLVVLVLMGAWADSWERAFVRGLATGAAISVAVATSKLLLGRPTFKLIATFSVPDTIGLWFPTVIKVAMTGALISSIAYGIKRLFSSRRPPDA
jgi:hypothetical protein